MRIVAFYLPQYHPIPENDRWWGKGFTDWTNVIKARPRFKGHYQPHIPADLGYYDLRREETRLAQAKLAAEHGIAGFCYYHYYFNGKLLLESPFNEVLATGKPDFPFCLCWANENWTRCWDGADHEILMQQDYQTYDHLEHIRWLLKAFKDERYITISGKPLFLIYNASAIPELDKKISDWRGAVKDAGFPDLYMCSVQSVPNTLRTADALRLGFDGAVSFYPHSSVRGSRRFTNRVFGVVPRLINKLIRHSRLEKRVRLLSVTGRFSYKRLVDNVLKLPAHPSVFPCVMPSWDNTPRKRVNGGVYQNDDPSLYGDWLRHALRTAGRRPYDEQLVFINAWNEWAEGCHLEPDLKNGKAFLEETKNALASFEALPRTETKESLSEGMLHTTN